MVAYSEADEETAMTAETLQAAVLNAPIEVQDQILAQLADRYFDRHPGQEIVPIDNGTPIPRVRLYRHQEPPKTPPMSEERKAEMLKRMERLDDAYTPEELIERVMQLHEARHQAR